MVEKKVTKIQWTRKAKRRLKDIKSYYKENASEIVANRIVTNIAVSVSNLYIYPNMGQVEPYLENFSETYRYRKRYEKEECKKTNVSCSGVSLYG